MVIGKLLGWIWLWTSPLTSQGFTSPIFGISILRIWNILAVISGFIATVNIHWWLDHNFIEACLWDLGRRVRERRATQLTAQWRHLSIKVFWDHSAQTVMAHLKKKKTSDGSKYIYIFHFLFIWLHQVLAAAWGIFSWGMQTLSCDLWDLVPWPGIEPWTPALAAQCISYWTTREVLEGFLKIPSAQAAPQTS